MSRQNQNWAIDWRSDYIRKGARFVIKDKEGNSQGRLDFLSKPEIEFGDNNGYVTVKIRAACIGSDGKPVTDVKLERQASEPMSSTTNVHNARKQEAPLIDDIGDLPPDDGMPF